MHEFSTAELPGPGQSPIRITISIGVASTPLEDDQDEVELFSRADQALYEAKRNWRNCVVLYAEPGELIPEATPIAPSDADV